MKLKNAMLVTTDMNRSLEFYQKVLGMDKITDSGVNVTLTGGLSLQKREIWAYFIGVNPDELGWFGRNSEIYFEEDEFDSFIEKIEKLDVCYVHPVKEQPWGQRVVRFYDPDGHIIEVGENLKTVCKRFLESGMSPEQVARRMDTSIEFVYACMK